MDVQSKILMNKMRGEVHRAGQPIIGVVKYNVSKPMKCRRVTLSVVGKGKCMWKEGSLTQSRKHKGTEEYLVMRKIVNEGEGDSITLEGENIHQFYFILPKNIPPSYKDKIGHVSYYMELEFVKSDFSSPTVVFRTKISVHNYVKPLKKPITFEITKKLFSPFNYLPCVLESSSPVINLIATINNPLVTPGENIQISYKVSNKTEVTIKSVKTTIFRHTTYKSNDGQSKCSVAKIKTCRTETSSIPKREVTLLTCELPTLPEMYSIKNSNVVSVDYKVQANIQLPIPYRNATAEKSVLIGEVMGDLSAAIESLYDREQPTTNTVWQVMEKVEKGRKDNNNTNKHKKNKNFHRENNESNEESSDDSSDDSNDDSGDDVCDGESSSENNDEANDEDNNENNDEASEEDNDENDNDST